MGQVPQKQPLYGLIGNGRVGRHFNRYFQILDIPFRHWHRNESHRTSVHAMHTLRDCDIILLAISDDSIPGFWNACRKLAPKKRFVHFSGSLTLPHATGVHPLMTFGPTLYDRQTYESIPFVVDRKVPGFRRLFPSLPNPHHSISPEEKPFYHSLCVMGGNFTTILWNKLQKEFESKLHLPADIAEPYIRKVMENICLSPHQALTGPLARGDQTTIQSNLNALSEDPFRDVYRAFVEVVENGH